MSLEAIPLDTGDKYTLITEWGQVTSPIPHGVPLHSALGYTAPRLDPVPLGIPSASSVRPCHTFTLLAKQFLQQQNLSVSKLGVNLKSTQCLACLPRSLVLTQQNEASWKQAVLRHMVS